MKQLLLGIQELLDTPNPNSPAQVRHQPCVTSLLLYCELQEEGVSGLMGDLSLVGLPRSRLMGPSGSYHVERAETLHFPPMISQSDAYMIFTNNTPEYKKRVKEQSRKYPPPA